MFQYNKKHFLETWYVCRGGGKYLAKNVRSTGIRVNRWGYRIYIVIHIVKLFLIFLSILSGSKL